MTQTATPSGQKLVVLHKGLGNFRRGNVIDATDVPGGEDGLTRLLSLKSVRRVLPGEENLNHVDLADEEREASFNSQLAEKDQLIMALQTKIRDLNEQLSRGTPQIQAALDAERVQHNALLQTKDRTINDIQNKYKILDEKLQAEQQKGRDLAHEVEILKSRLVVASSGQQADTPSADELRQRINAVQQQAAQSEAGQTKASKKSS